MIGKRDIKNNSTFIIKSLLNKDLRTLVIQAGFPYYHSPNLYQWLWVFILLPFLPEYTLNDLSEKHGKELRKLYKILINHPLQFQKLISLLSVPLFFDLLEDFENADATKQSRTRLQLIIDDTKSEKYGSCMEFIHKLFDSNKKKYMMGYNYVFVVVASGNFVFPLTVMLWLPKSHVDHRSKNDMVVDFIHDLKNQANNRNKTLSEVEVTFDSAYCIQKVIQAACIAQLRIISKPSNNHKFEFAGDELTPTQIIEKVEANRWKSLDKERFYQRLLVKHHLYGEVVLIVRKKLLKNGKVVYDVLLCNQLFYNANRIDKAYKKRWQIEIQFKCYKQYLNLGKSHFRKLGAIQSQLCCVAIAGLLVALYRRQCRRLISFRDAVKCITCYLFKPKLIYNH